MLCWGNLDVGAALIDRHPDTRFIIDHLGIMQPRVPPAPPQPWADLPKVLELAKRKNAVIKVSGACTLSKEPYPFNDIWDPLARVFDAWGFDRCLWGTDWTRAFAVVNYEQAVKPFLETKRLSDSERAMLMGGACAKGLSLDAEERLSGPAPKRKPRHLRRGPERSEVGRREPEQGSTQLRSGGDALFDLGRLAQHIAAAPDGLDVVLAPGGVRELLAQLADEHVDDLEFGLVHAAIEMIEEHLLGQRRALAEREQLQHLVFLAGQMHARARSPRRSWCRD